MHTFCRSLIASFFILLFVLSATGCGVKTDPVPPSHNTKQAS